VGDINFVNTNHQTLYGNIVSQWQKTEDSFSLTVEIPANTKALIYLPEKKAIKFLRRTNQLLIVLM
jgi:alpha-L-rhamnosidase